MGRGAVARKLRDRSRRARHEWREAMMCLGSYGWVGAIQQKRFEEGRGDGSKPCYYEAECPDCGRLCAGIYVKGGTFIVAQHEDPRAEAIDRDPSGFCVQCYPLARALVEGNGSLGAKQ